MDENTMIAFIMLLIWGTWCTDLNIRTTGPWRINQIKENGPGFKDTLQNILKIKGKEIEDADELTDHQHVHLSATAPFQKDWKQRSFKRFACAITDALLIHPDQAGTREKFIATNLANYYTINGAESESKRIISLIHQGVHENPSARLMDITIAAVEQMLKNRKEAQPGTTAYYRKRKNG